MKEKLNKIMTTESKEGLRDQNRQDEGPHKRPHQKSGPYPG